MKKFLLTFVAAVSSLFAGTAWADTEVIDGSAGTAASNAVSGTSLSLDKDNNAGSSSTFYYNGNNTIKVRCGKTIDDIDNCIKFTVTEGHTVNEIKGFGRANFNGTITWSAVYVDDDFETNLLPFPIVFAGSGKYTKSTSKSTSYVAMPFNLFGLNATKNIYIVTDGGALVSDASDSDSNNGQLIFGATVTYDLTFPERPDDAKDVKISWVFDEGKAEKVVTMSDNGEAFSTAAVTLGSNLSYDGTDTKLGTTTTTVKASASGSTEANQLTFSVTPWEGITFVPTKVYFQAKKHGTSNDYIDTNGFLTYTAKGDKTVTLGSSLNPTRNSNSSATACNLTVPSLYGSDINTITSTNDNPFELGLILLQNKSYSFANIVIEGYYSGTAVKSELFTVSTSVNDSKAGTIDIYEQSFTKGSTVELKATPNTGYKFVKWTENDEEVSTNATLTIESLESNRTFVAVFEALPSVTYVAGDGVEGTAPAKAYYEKGDEITLGAKNYYLYKDGYTQTGWTDGEQEYALGSTLTVTDDVTLTAVFTENVKTFVELVAEPRTSDLVVNWSFNQNTGAPVVNIENKTGIYVLPVEVNGTLIDLKMEVNAVKNAVINNATGKLNNVSGITNAQANPGTKMTIPVAVGGVVAFDLNKGTISNSTINGVAGTTYTCTEDGNVDLIVNDKIYLNAITVTYPANAYAVTISDLAAATLCLPKSVTIPEGVEAYTGVLSDDNSTLTLNKVADVIPAEEAVVLLGEAGSYNFAISSEEGTKAESNSLKGNATAEAVTPSETGVVTVLDKVNDVLGFYKWTGAIPAYKAYLPVAVTAGQAPTIRVVFGDEPGNVTAIETIAAEHEANAPIFNLAGQKVQGVAKGLYIQGGKKIYVK